LHFLPAPSDLGQLDKAFIFSKVYHVVTDCSDCAKTITKGLEGNYSSKLNNESPAKKFQNKLSLLKGVIHASRHKKYLLTS